MVGACCAFNCTNRRVKGTNIRFYGFPLSNKALLDQWIRALKRENWRPTRSSLLCSEHFDDSCFRHYATQTRLKEDAVPTVFNVPQHLQPKKIKARRILVRASATTSTSNEAACTSTESTTMGIYHSNSNTITKEHDYGLLSSPVSIKRKYDILLSSDRRSKETLRKRMKVVRRRLIRHQSRMKTMKDIIEKLKTRPEVSAAAVETIERCFGHIPAEMLKRKIYSNSKEAYSEELRSFAMTLHFYSSKAYNFARKSFGKSLPHPSSLRSWYTSVEGKPGFTQEAFECLRIKSSATETPLLCTLMFDELSIRKHVQWNGKENEGFINMVTKLDDDSLPIASEVLMFQVVALNAPWKLPIAYFLIDGLSSDVKANLVKEAMIRLHQVNVRVVAIVCDGPATNFAVADKLGASLNIHDMKPFFAHPCDLNWLVYIIFDAAHMLKLMRNTLADKGVLTVGAGGQQIRWQHISDLYYLQDSEGLKAANKLRRGHIDWYTQKMKVSLAAQTFSRSVASALEFVSDDIHLKKFSDVAATVKFIRVMDRLFDTLNSKNPFGKEFKSVLRSCNEQYWRPFLVETCSYLTALYLNGVPLHQSPRKTSVIGFVATITSVIGLFDEFVKSGQLAYLATHRLSQDHIELTFNVVRSRGRWNNNPTAGQFRSAYRQLLMKHNITPKSSGNAVAQEGCDILPAVPVSLDHVDESARNSSSILARCHPNAEQTSSSFVDHTYSLTPDNLKLSEFSSNIVTYIGGRVSRKLCEKLSCPGCKSELLSKAKIAENCKLLTRKDAGGLIYPSRSVVRVCTEAEKQIRFVYGRAGHSVPHKRNLQVLLQRSVIENTQHLALFVDSVDDMEHTCVWIR